MNMRSVQLPQTIAHVSINRRPWALPWPDPVVTVGSLASMTLVTLVVLQFLGLVHTGIGETLVQWFITAEFEVNPIDHHGQSGDAAFSIMAAPLIAAMTIRAGVELLRK